MHQLIRLGGCIHIFDTAQKKFVKVTATTLRYAISTTKPGATRRSILHDLQWVRCKAPQCQFKNCQEKGHWTVDPGSIH